MMKQSKILNFNLTQSYQIIIKHCFLNLHLIKICDVRKGHALV